MNKQKRYLPIIITVILVIAIGVIIVFSLAHNHRLLKENSIEIHNEESSIEEDIIWESIQSPDVSDVQNQSETQGTVVIIGQSDGYPDETEETMDDNELPIDWE